MRWVRMVPAVVVECCAASNRLFPCVPLVVALRLPAPRTVALVPSEGSARKATTRAASSSLDPARSTPSTSAMAFRSATVSFFCPSSLAVCAEGRGQMSWGNYHQHATHDPRGPSTPSRSPRITLDSASEALAKPLKARRAFLRDAFWPGLP